MLLSALGKSLLSGRKKKKSKSGKEVSQQVLNRSNNKDEKPTIKPQSSLVPLSIKTTTIPTDNLITTKEDSVKDKLLMIKDLLGLQLKFRLSSFFQKVKNMREERRKKREKELEENKEKKTKLSFLNIIPKTGILDSLKNFLAFLGGGILLNLLLKELERIKPILAKLAPIAKGIAKVAKFLWNGVIGFITTAYDKYDEFRESIRDLGGDEAVEKFDKISDLLKTVINGAIIAATVSLVAKPFLKKGCIPTPTNLRNKNFRNTNMRGTGGTRTTSGGRSLNRGPLNNMREFIRNITKKFRPMKITGASPNAGPIQRIGGQLKKVGELLKPENIKKLSLKNRQFSSFTSPGLKNLKLSPSLVKGGATAGISIAADLAVDAAFGAIDKKIGRDQVKKLVREFGAVEALDKIQKRLEKEANKPVAPWWMLGLADGNGTGITKFRDQKFINQEAYKFNYLTERLSEFSKGDKKAFDLSDGSVDLIKSIKSIDDLAQDTSYSNGSYGLITEINNIIQPIVQEV